MKILFMVILKIEGEAIFNLCLSIDFNLLLD